MAQRLALFAVTTAVDQMRCRLAHQRTVDTDLLSLEFVSVGLPMVGVDVEMDPCSALARHEGSLQLTPTVSAVAEICQQPMTRPGGNGATSQTSAGSSMFAGVPT